MKVAICMLCMDFVSAHRDWQTNHNWRWCTCRRTGVKWRDGLRGLLQVTSVQGPHGVRVLGLNNAFLEPALAGLVVGEDVNEDWRVFHDLVAEKTAPSYLFSERRRQCWAVIIKVGETSDIEFVEYCNANPPPSPGSSTD